MRVLLTGGVGLRRLQPRATCSPRTAPRSSRRRTPTLDLTRRRRDAAAASARSSRTRSSTPAILNDPAGDGRRPARGVGRVRRGDAQRRRRGTRGAHVVLVSTDWVFDGTQGPAREDDAAEPGQPVRLPEGGERAGRARARERGTVARIAGVQGIHRAAARPAQSGRTASATSSPRWSRRCGRASRSRSGRARRSTGSRRPTLATDAARADLARARARGAPACCTAAAASTSTARGLARRAAAAFGLDPALCAPARRRSRRPSRSRTTRGSTRPRRRAALGVELPDLDNQLARLRHEMEER